MSDELLERVVLIDQVVESALESSHLQPCSNLEIPQHENWIQINLGRQQQHTTWSIYRLMRDKSAYVIASYRASVHYPRSVQNQIISGSLDNVNRFRGLPPEKMPSLIILDYGFAPRFKTREEREGIATFIRELGIIKREPIPVVVLGAPVFQVN